MSPEVSEHTPAAPRPKLRRARRLDFDAVMELAARHGITVEGASKATVRRFRNLVNDLGTDLYLAFADGAGPVGLVHVSYTRQLADLPRADIEWLIVDPHPRAEDVFALLLDFARKRAGQRGCSVVRARPPLGVPADALRAAGFSPGEPGFILRLTSGPQDE